MQWTEKDIQQTIDDVKRRATSDEAFRALALRDPRAAIAKITPKPIPDDVRIKFVDGGGAHMTIVLPALTQDRALSDEELDVVAGGSGAKGADRAVNDQIRRF